ncbi:putative Succinylglutamate desuccinylase/aspartoacylase [Hyphomicrobiales bacterium]|nr:putative Succinylglutamate desuccinylase/aspartoacylase [Hyphomicrobiales bacterium]CAH1693343.1 putative Succinylglutamate desuccinylase/aspartoacylase [Hyphomicrobiales bacterium]
MVMDMFTLGGISAEPGRAAFGYIKAIELVDGTDAGLPVHLVNGAKPGPTVFIGAGAHGDEINGVRAVVEAVSRIDPSRLAGRVVAVPVQNPIAYRARFRLVTLNQLDSQNMHRCFPGSAGGDTSARLCNLILEKIIKAAGASFVIDCHTGSTGSYYPPLVFVSTIGPQDAVEKSLAGARAFNAPLTIQAGGKAGVYALGNMLHMVAIEQGIPAIGCELGTALPAEDKHSTVGADGIMNVLAHLGMIEAPPPDTSGQVILDEIFELRAERGGICDYLVSPGDPVQEGQAVARVINVFGDVVEEIASPITGRVVTCTYWGSINQGERLVRIGRSTKTAA